MNLQSISQLFYDNLAISAWKSTGELAFLTGTFRTHDVEPEEPNVLMVLVRSKKKRMR